MKYMKVLIQRFGEKRTSIFLFCFGVSFGILFSRIFKRFYWNEIDLLNKNYFQLIQTMDIDYKQLRNYVLWKDFRNYILLWGLSFTKFGISYIALFILYYGFQSGFFLSVIIMGYGLKGFLLVIGYTFPQIIIYVPVMLISLQGGYWLCRNLYHDNIHRKGPREVVAKYIIFIVILGFFLFLGALLETYVGSSILRRILSVFN